MSTPSTGFPPHPTAKSPTKCSRALYSPHAHTDNRAAASAMAGSIIMGRHTSNWQQNLVTLSVPITIKPSKQRSKKPFLNEPCLGPAMLSLFSGSACGSHLLETMRPTESLAQGPPCIVIGGCRSTGKRDANTLTGFVTRNASLVCIVTVHHRVRFAHV